VLAVRSALRTAPGGQAWAPKPEGEGGCLCASVCRLQRSGVGSRESRM